MMKNLISRIAISVLVLASALSFLVCSPIVSAKEGPSGTGTLIISNDVLKVSIDDALDEDGIGTFTIGTNGSHPSPYQDVFYDGASEDPWSSFTTIRVEDTLTEYVTSWASKTPSSGYTAQILDDYSPVVTRIDATRATISWTTAENLFVTLLIAIRGSTIADTMVEVTVTVENNDLSPHRVAVRHQWDIMIDGEDDSWIREWSDPGSPQAWTENETDWVSPTFMFWEATNNPSAPVFSIYGSISLPNVDPPPTPPDRFVYASWAAADDTAYNFSISGDWGMDSAVLYYWEAVDVDPGEEIRRTAYVATVQAELAALVWSSDSVGVAQTVFNVSDSVYVRGEGFPADTDVTVYLIPDGQQPSPATATATTNVTTTGDGGIATTLLWSDPLILGVYDIWVDVDQNGSFDESDVWNSQAAGIYATEVIPEFSSMIILTLLLLVSFGVTIHRRRLTG